MGNNATGGNLIGSLLKGGGSSKSSGGAAGLGALAGLLGGKSGGGAGDLLGALTGLAGKSGGLGGLAGLLGGGKSAPVPQAPEPAPPPPQHSAEAAQQQAVLMIRAMCNSAKVDGQIDEGEQQAILGRLGEVSQAEMDFVRRELSTPLDVAAFAASVPRDLAPAGVRFLADGD